MDAQKEIGFCTKITLALLFAIVIAVVFRGKANAAEYRHNDPPTLHYAEVLKKDDRGALILLEDGNLWNIEGLNDFIDGYAAYIMDDNPSGFTLVTIDTVVGVCINDEKDGTCIMDCGEIADPVYNYISYTETEAKPGDVVLTTLYRVTGTCDDYVARNDAVMYNIYERR